MAPPDEIPGRDFYGRSHPTLSTRLRWDVVGDLFVELGAAYTENWFQLDPQSTLATDMNAGAPAVRELLGTATRHGVLLAENALIYDTRDSEIAPEQGQYHQLKIRYSPAIGDHLPYQYGQANATFRFYRRSPHASASRSGRWATGSSATCRSTSWRATRTRSRSAASTASAASPASATTAASSCSRTSSCERACSTSPGSASRTPWAAPCSPTSVACGPTSPSHPELDGSGLGLKYGVGGGLRLQQGKTFVIRVDVAWSPDARPIGAYLTAGHAF